MATIPYDERLEHLLRTAARVFAEKGYHATTMRDLARATGMSLAGMYYYVQGKDELLFVIQERCFQQVLAGATAAVAETSSPVERVTRFIHHHLGFFASHMSEMKVLSHEARSLTGPRLDKVNRLKRRYVDLLAELITNLDVDGDGRPDPRIAAYGLFGMMNWIYTWYDPKGPVSPETLADHFAQLFLTGALGSPSAVAQGGL
ncbi:MAG TPA: TetR/AcrR family transcriptional regulator [Gemmatimonadales bacterium]|jgi:AcrR family transcriptional regulator|nr:TetR/AcrR family transcriptional regulator [Gemmatimonadales bacterium]